MEEKFSVSVITPVYNAEKFLKDAVLSVLAIDCVAEILLIEDNSPDNCLSICKELELKYQKVKLLRHPNGENRGAGASRNLGIEKAQSNFISFLDADDYYLPNRFDDAKELFSRDVSIDFTFGAAQDEKDYKTQNERLYQVNTLYIKRKISLFDALISETYGFFHTNSITIRKDSLFKLNGLFNSELRLHQDSELWLRMAYHLNGIRESSQKPIAVIRQHALNRITHKNDVSMLLFWRTVYTDFKNERISRKQKSLISNYIKLREKKTCYPFINRLYNLLIKFKIKILRFG